VEVPHATDRPLAMLWELEWNADRLTCAIYRHGSGLQLRVESAVAVIVTERFDLQPRALARARTLRQGLKRRGWRDTGRVKGRAPDREI
jgi:hypothetical protein